MATEAMGLRRSRLALSTLEELPKVNRDDTFAEQVSQKDRKHCPAGVLAGGMAG